MPIILEIIQVLRVIKYTGITTRIVVNSMLTMSICISIFGSMVDYTTKHFSFNETTIGLCFLTFTLIVNVLRFIALKSRVTSVISVTSREVSEESPLLVEDFSSTTLTLIKDTNIFIGLCISPLVYFTGIPTDFYHIFGIFPITIMGIFISYAEFKCLRVLSTSEVGILDTFKDIILLVIGILFLKEYNSFTIHNYVFIFFTIFQILFKAFIKYS
jgi:hypothetical protein